MGLRSGLSGGHCMNEIPECWKKFIEIVAMWDLPISYTSTNFESSPKAAGTTWCSRRSSLHHEAGSWLNSKICSFIKTYSTNKYFDFLNDSCWTLFQWTSLLTRPSQRLCDSSIKSAGLYCHLKCSTVKFKRNLGNWVIAKTL